MSTQPAWLVDLLWTTAQWAADCLAVTFSTSLFMGVCIPLFMEILASVSGAEHELAYYTEPKAIGA